MYNQVIVPTFAESKRERAMATIARATERLDAISKLFAPTLPGVYNGGDAIWRLTFADKAARDAALASETWASAAALLADATVTTHLNEVAFPTGQVGGPTGGGGLYRVALFCANVRPDADRLEAFATQTASLPRYITTIRRWQIARGESGRGDKPWNAVWEQEYADRAGLEGAYMLHPAHWAHVERWFDPEYPEWLVDPVLVHTFCAIDRPVIVG